MTTTATTIIKFLIFAVICLCFTSNSPEAHARTFDEPCQKAEIVFARGSGQSLGGDENDSFKEQLENRLKGESVKSHHYELGTEKYGGYQYPAVNVGNAWNALGAVTSSGYAHDYGDSVKHGMWELKAYLQERTKKCVGSYFVLGGYSQGAQVIGQSLSGLSQEIRNRIIYVALFGDPKLYFPEGQASDWFTPPPACQGKDYSVYRRSYGECRLAEGRLGARKPYLPTDMLQKTGLWCNGEDYVCGTSHWIFAPGHTRYANDGWSIDSAAQEAATRIKIAIENEPIPPRKPSDPPAVAVQIDTNYHFGMGLNGQDVVYLVDISGNMESQLPQIRKNLKMSIPKIIAKGGRVAVFMYTGFAPTAGGIPFGLLGSDAAMNNMYIDAYIQSHPSITQGLPQSALNSTMLTLQWNWGAAKSLILLTNKTPVFNPDTYGISKHIVAQTSLAIDPVNIYPVVPESVAGEYADIAEMTAGHLTTYTDDIEAAMDRAFDKTQNRPVPFLKNTEYLADVGQEIRFDASDSYVIDAEITKYDWDFEGDGVFDATTTEPVMHHTYTDLFDGLMQVRVTASNGLHANMSAVVKVGTYVVPVFAHAPENLQVKVIETVDNISKVELTWDAVADEDTASIALSVNGVALGIMTRDRTSIVVTDIDRTYDNDFGITALDADGKLGHSIYASLHLIEPPVIEEPMAPVPQAPRRQADQPADAPVLVPTEGYDIRQDLDPTNDEVLGKATSAKSETPNGGGAWYWILIPFAIVGGVLWRLRVRTSS